MSVLRHPVSIGLLAHSQTGRYAQLTLAVVFPQELKALHAASIASFVSATPISGTVPSSSSVDGSEKS